MQPRAIRKGRHAAQGDEPPPPRLPAWGVRPPALPAAAPGVAWLQTSGLPLKPICSQCSEPLACVDAASVGHVLVLRGHVRHEPRAQLAVCAALRDALRAAAAPGRGGSVRHCTTKPTGLQFTQHCPCARPPHARRRRAALRKHITNKASPGPRPHLLIRLQLRDRLLPAVDEIHDAPGRQPGHAVGQLHVLRGHHLF